MRAFFRRRVACLASHWIPGLALVVAAGLVWSHSASADSPQLQFDVHPLVECRDVTSAEFRAVNRGERLIEARIAISVLTAPDAATELAELLVRVESPDRTAIVADYAPRTALEPEIAGNVRVERHEESTKTLDFRFKANYYLFADADVKGSSNSRTTADTHYEKLPPLELCVASGTVNRGFGAYFKWKPSARTTLEGEREILLVLRVPQAWRGDCLTVRCEAFGREPMLLNTHAEPQRWVRRSFVVALYEAGDEAARADAVRLLRAESQLRGQVAAQRKQLQRSFQPKPLVELGGLLAGRDSPLPDSWWDQAVYGPMAAGVDPRVASRIPQPVREALGTYHEARRVLRVASAKGSASVAATANTPQRVPTVE